MSGAIPHVGSLARLRDYLLWTFAPRPILERWRSQPVLSIASWATVHLIGDPELVRRVHSLTGKVFLGGGGNEFLGPLLGRQSVFLLDGRQHLLARSLISRAVKLEVIRDRRSEMECLSRGLIAEVGRRGTADLGKSARWLAFQLVLGLTLPPLDPAEARKLFDAFEQCTGVTGNLVVYNRALWQPSGPLSIGRIVAGLVRRVDAIVRKSIAAAHLTRGSASDGTSLLALLLQEQQTHGYDKEFLRDTVVSTIAAGYDTSGAALAWLVFWLQKQPSPLIAGLRQEVLELDGTCGPRCRSFINETLRYCPPIEILPRTIASGRVEEAAQLLDAPAEEMSRDHVIAAPCPYAVHHNGDVFPDPERFVPDRFTNGSYGYHEFFPFGGGNRFCLGKLAGEAMLETFLATLMIEGKLLRLTRDRRFAPVRRGVSLWPGYRLKVKVVPVGEEAMPSAQLQDVTSCRLTRLR